VLADELGLLLEPRAWSPSIRQGVSRMVRSSEYRTSVSPRMRSNFGSDIKRESMVYGPDQQNSIVLVKARVGFFLLDQSLYSASDKAK
jgi:hypothetical protein